MPLNHTYTTAMFGLKYTISNVHSSHSGTYTCVVSNPIGSNSTTIHIIYDDTGIHSSYVCISILCY